VHNLQNPQEVSYSSNFLFSKCSLPDSKQKVVQEGRKLNALQKIRFIVLCQAQRECIEHIAAPSEPKI